MQQARALLCIIPVMASGCGAHPPESATMTATSCQPTATPPPGWQTENELTLSLGPNTQVFSSAAGARWAVAIGHCVFASNGPLRWKTLTMSSANGSPTTAMAAAAQAPLAINGGYFGWRSWGLESVSLVVSAGREVAWSLQDIEGTFFQRAAIGFSATGRADAAWSYHPESGGTMAFWQLLPLRSSPALPPQAEPRSWAVTEAVGGGPMLLWNHERITPAAIRDEFFTGRIDEAKRRGRTAIGYDDQGNVVVMVLDEKGGATLTELTDLLAPFQLRTALNLDGGGSSTLVIRGRRLVPFSRAERPVFGALALVPQD